MGRAVRFIAGLVVCAAAVGTGPAAAMAGSISGKVTAQSGGAPIQGVEVCPRREPYTVETACTVTDGAGNYSLAGLPQGSYKINFSTSRANLKYVSEFYNDKERPWEADLVSIEANQNLTGLDVQLADGGSISGVVTAEGSGSPISGIRACAIDHEGIPASCSDSGPNGEYQLNGLRSGKYSVEFEGGNRVNYLREFYKDAETWAAAEDVQVEAPSLTPGIDALLAPGAQILGHVGEIGSGAPMAGVMVCAEAQVGEFEDCERTNTAGDYALRSLPARTYIVAFGIEYLPFGRQAVQWWQGVSSKAAATPIGITPPETRGGIDAQLVNPYPKPKVAVTILPPPKKKRRPPKCHKGFHRKKIHGKSRCVRKHKRAHSHKHGSHRTTA